MAFRSAEEITKALIDGATTVKSIRNCISRYRTDGRVKEVLLYSEGLEWFIYETKYSPEAKARLALLQGKNTV